MAGSKNSQTRDNSIYYTSLCAKMKCHFLLLTLCVLSIISRISPSPERIPSRSQTYRYLLQTVCFSPTLFDVDIHDLVSSNWNRYWRSRLLRSANRSSRPACSCSQGMLKLILVQVPVTRVVPVPSPFAPTNSVSTARYAIFCIILNVSKYPLRNIVDLAPVMRDGAVRNVLKRHFPFLIPLFPPVLWKVTT